MPNFYAKYYKFNVPDTTQVWFSLTSDAVDIRVFLLNSKRQVIRRYSWSPIPPPIYDTETREYYAEEQDQTDVHFWTFLDAGDYVLEVTTDQAESTGQMELKIHYGDASLYDFTNTDDCTSVTEIAVDGKISTMLDATDTGCMVSSIHYGPGTECRAFEFTPTETKPYIITVSTCPWDNPDINTELVVLDGTDILGYDDAGHGRTNKVLEYNSKLESIPFEQGTTYTLEAIGWGDYGEVFLQVMEPVVIKADYTSDFLPMELSPSGNISAWISPYINQIEIKDFFLAPDWTNGSGLPYMRIVDFTCTSTEKYHIGVRFEGSAEYNADNTRMGTPDSTLYMEIYDSSDVLIASGDPLSTLSTEWNPKMFDIDLTSGEVYRFEIVDLGELGYTRLDWFRVGFRNIKIKRSVPRVGTQDWWSQWTWPYSLDSSGFEFHQHYIYTDDTGDPSYSGILIDETSDGNDFDYEVSVTDMDGTEIADYTSYQAVTFDFIPGEAILLNIHLRSVPVNNLPFKLTWQTYLKPSTYAKYNVEDAYVNASIIPDGTDSGIASSSSGYAQVRATHPKTTGRWYAEFYSKTATNSIRVGIGRADIACTNTYIGANANSWGMYSQYSNQYSYHGGGSVLLTSNNYRPTSYRTLVAVDIDKGKVWFGNSGYPGLWFGNARYDIGIPSTGYDPTFTDNDIKNYPIALMVSPTTSTNNDIILCTNPADCLLTPPNSFKYWEDEPYTEPPVINLNYDVWNPADKHADYLIDNYQTITCTSSPPKSIRSRQQNIDGKYYVEFVMNELSPTSYACTAGVATDAVGLGAYFSQSSQGWSGALQQGVGLIGLNANAATTLIADTLVYPGQTMMMAIDMVANKIWFGYEGTWSGDPAAGTGEYKNNVTYNNLHIAGAVHTSGDQTTSITCHTDPATQQFTPPVGFGPWIKHPVEISWAFGADTTVAEDIGVLGNDIGLELINCSQDDKLIFNLRSGTAVDGTDFNDNTALTEWGLKTIGIAWSAYTPGAEITLSEGNQDIYFRTNVVWDAEAESDETFYVDATYIDADDTSQFFTQTIVINNVPAVYPYLVVNDGTGLEGQYATFTIDTTDTNAPTDELYVNITGGTAIDGTDYDSTMLERYWSAAWVPATNPMTLLTDASTAIQFRFPVFEDLETDDTETITVDATIIGTRFGGNDTTSTGTVTLFNYESILPGVTVSDVTVAEGNNAIFNIDFTDVQTEMTFAMSLIDVEALDGTDYNTLRFEYSADATNWTDYTGQSVALPDATSSIVYARTDVPYDMSTGEPDETFKLEVIISADLLGDYTGSGICTIEDASVPANPDMTILDSTGLEDDYGTFAIIVGNAGDGDTLLGVFDNGTADSTDYNTVGSEVMVPGGNWTDFTEGVPVTLPIGDSTVLIRTDLPIDATHPEDTVYFSLDATIHDIDRDENIYASADCTIVSVEQILADFDYWDVNSQGGGIVVSGDHSEIITSTTNNYAIRSTMLKKTGKHYVEFDFADLGDSPGGGDLQFGVTLLEYSAVNTTVGQGTYSWGLDIIDGVGLRSVSNRSEVQVLSGPFTTGSIGMLAVDCATGDVWLGCDGTWSGDPAAGTGADLNIQSGYAATYGIYLIGSCDPSASGSMISRTPDLNYAAPVGFREGWYESPPVLTYWSDTDHHAECTVTGVLDDQMITDYAPGTRCGRSAESVTNGTWYVEFGVINSTPTVLSGGLCTLAASLAGQVGSQTGQWGFYASESGGVVSVKAYDEGTLGATLTSDTCDLVDSTTRIQLAFNFSTGYVYLGINNVWYVTGEGVPAIAMTAIGGTDGEGNPNVAMFLLGGVQSTIRENLILYTDPDDMLYNEVLPSTFTSYTKGWVTI